MALPGSQILNDINQGKTLIQGNSAFASVTYGWWVFIGCVGAIVLAGTPVAGPVLAIMSMACLFQLEKLVSHQ